MNILHPRPPVGENKRPDVRQGYHHGYTYLRNVDPGELVKEYENNDGIDHVEKVQRKNNLGVDFFLIRKIRDILFFIGPITQIASPFECRVLRQE